jgi:hypothetical protein
VHSAWGSPDQLPDCEVAIAATGAGLSTASCLCAKARRIAMMTAYPQAMPNANEKTIVKKTAEEASRVLIGIF